MGQCHKEFHFKIEAPRRMGARATAAGTPFAITIAVEDFMIADIVHIGGATETKAVVLIVEDEPTARRALRVLLASHGYQAIAVATAEDALTYVAREGIPRVALIDLNLPGMNGLDLIRRLEDISPTIYPVLVTAVDRESIRRSGFNRRMNYMQKPVDFGRLLAIIRECPVVA
jgi:CheY-like chemotaxis protein